MRERPPAGDDAVLGRRQRRDRANNLASKSPSELSKACAWSTCIAAGFAAAQLSRYLLPIILTVHIRFGTSSSG